MNYGWNVELWVNFLMMGNFCTMGAVLNHWWIWTMGKCVSCVNIIYGEIWIMGDYELCVNMNYGWVWIMGEYELW